MSNLTPARVPHPGKIIQKELDARGWSRKRLAEEMGRSLYEVILLISSDATRINGKLAVELGEAFGTSAVMWTRMDAAYRVWKERNRAG